MKTYFLLIILMLTSSCAVQKDTDKGYSKNQKKQVVNEIDKKLKSDANADLCDLRFLLNTFGRYARKYEDFELDDVRINFIKDELTKLYKDYTQQKKSVIVVSSAELKKRVNCYLDYLTNEQYQPVSFYEFWEDKHYKKFRCHITAN